MEESCPWAFGGEFFELSVVVVVAVPAASMEPWAKSWRSSPAMNSGGRTCESCRR